MKKITFLCFAVILNVFFFESVTHAFSLNISPPSFKAQAEPGGSISGSITVQNNSEDDMGILVYTQDWQYNPDGGKSFFAAGTTPRSCAKWIRLFPKKFQLKGGEKGGVEYIITLPEDAEGGYYAVIFFESVPVGDIEGEEGMVVRFSGRLGTIVYIETKGKSVHKGSIDSLSIAPPQSNKPLEMLLSFKNSGNVYIGADGTLNVMDDEGNIYVKEKFGPVNTLPGETREAKVEWLGELEPGTYYAVVTLDIGADEPIVKEVELTVLSGGIIESLLVDTSSGKPEFSTAVKNTGQLNIDVAGRIDILKENSEVVKSLDLKKSLIAPGKEKALVVSLEENLPKGTYTAKAIISIGAKEFSKEEIFVVE